MASEVVGIEIIVEPDVVPKGTVDLRSLDAPPGTMPPLRRIEPDGRVYLIERDGGATTTIAAPVVAPPPPAVVPVTPAVEEEPLGVKLRKKIHSDTAMPPRPASAETSASGRHEGQAMPQDDYETTISGGFGSSLWSLVKVTAILAFFTLATVLAFLKWNDLLPWGTQASVPPVKIAAADPKKPDPPKVETPKPDPAPVPSAVPTTPPPEIAKVATNSVVGQLALVPEGDAKPLAEKTPDAPKVGIDIGQDNDYDLHRVEQLRADAVRLDREGKYDEALAKLDEILKLNPHDGDALFRRALNFHKRGDLKGAVKAYDASIAQSQDIRAYNNLGLCQEALGDLAAARASYKRGLERNPEDPNVLTNLGRLEEDEDPKTALARYEAALERKSDHVHARYHRAALLALRMDRAAEAKPELEKLVGDDSPVRAEALDALGKVAIKEGRFADAEKNLRDAIKARPALDEAHLYLGVALWQQGNARGAEDELRGYLEKNPRSAEGWKTLGAVYVKLDQLQEAKKSYEAALRIDDKDPDTHYDYALCAERFGNFLFAIGEYENVVKIQPNQWKALTNLGRLYRNAGRYDDALKYFERAIALRPNEPDLQLHKANVLIQLKRDQDARTALQEFVRLAPTSDPRVAQVNQVLGTAGPLRPANTTTTQGEKPKGS
jgi:tetratricopeptide (TPR) repeat protein